MKLSINLKSVPLIPLLKKNISLLLLLCLIIVALASAWVMFSEIRKVSQARVDNSAANIGKILRVNISQHAELEKRLEENSRFIPEDIANADAVGVPPTKTLTKE